MNLSSALTYIRENPLWNHYIKEMVGSEIPHLVMVMNPLEGLDQAFQLLTNGNYALPFTNWLSQGVERLQQQLNPVLKKTTQVLNEAAPNVMWVRIAKEAFLFGNLASFVLAAPGLRNAAMIAISKTTRFVDMVGLNGHKEEPLAVRQKAIKENLSKFAKMYGTGLGTASLLGLGAQLAAWKNLPVPKLIQWAHKKLGLEGGLYSKLPTASAVLLWAYPCYAGFYLFSRDQAEKKEIMVKALGFGLAFAVIPTVVKKAVDKGIDRWFASKALPGLKKTVTDWVGPKENVGLLADILTGCIGYTAIPTFTNLFMRRSRAEKLGLLDNPTAQPVTDLSVTTTVKDPLSSLSPYQQSSQLVATLPTHEIRPLQPLEPSTQGMPLTAPTSTPFLPPKPLVDSSPVKCLSAYQTNTFAPSPSPSHLMVTY